MIPKWLGLRRNVLVLAAALSAVLLLPSVAAALGTLDQAQTSTASGINSGVTVGQTFVAGLSGSLDTVELHPYDSLNGETVEIRTTSGGLPTATVLASGTVTSSAVDAWVPITFATPATVVAGTQYAIVVVENGDQLFLSTAELFTPGAYANGALVYESGSGWVVQGFQTDLAFKTYVTVPGPATYDFGGFYAPVANPDLFNVVKAGAGVALKFSLGGDQGLDIFAAGSPAVLLSSCPSGPPNVVVTATAGGSTLAYNPTTDTYTYNWKTQKSWRAMCGELQLVLDDGTTHSAFFKFK